MAATKSRPVTFRGEAFLPFFINATDLAAGTTQYISAPYEGEIESIITCVQVAISTGGTIKAKLGSTDVANSTVTLADAAVVGTVQRATTTKNDPTRHVLKDGAIQIIPAAAFNGGGAVAGYVHLVGSQK